jgi:metal-dependent amidase/aminoacylase/carboxypeptidase family protein
MSTTAVPTDLLEKLIRIRRELHRRPELGNEESGTARLVCRYLDELGLSYRSGVAGHGASWTRSRSRRRPVWTSPPRFPA